jgi:hypothetical protein
MVLGQDVRPVLWMQAISLAFVLLTPMIRIRIVGQVRGGKWLEGLVSTSLQFGGSVCRKCRRGCRRGCDNEEWTFFYLVSASTSISS